MKKGSKPKPVLRKTGDDYFVEYKAQGLTFQKPAGSNKEEALKVLKVMSESSGPEEYHHGKSVKETLADCLAEYVTSIKEEEAFLVKNDLSQFFQFLSAEYPDVQFVHDVLPRMIVKYQGSLERQGEIVNVRQKLLKIKDFFEFTKKRNWINDNPFYHVKLE